MHVSLTGANLLTHNDGDARQNIRLAQPVVRITQSVIPTHTHLPPYHPSNPSYHIVFLITITYDTLKLVQSQKFILVYATQHCYS